MSGYEHGLDEIQFVMFRTGLQPHESENILSRFFFLSVSFIQFNFVEHSSVATEMNASPENDVLDNAERNASEFQYVISRFRHFRFLKANSTE